MERFRELQRRHERLLNRRNRVDPDWHNGVFDRYRYPVVTADHVPLAWRYDLNPKTNPFMMERLGINAVFNPGAIEWNGRILLMCRVEGCDRKSFFAVAESESGVDRFRFWNEPVDLPETDDPDTNVYDMRLTRHEDGWIYGLFCTERKDPKAPPGDTSTAVAQCGIARTKDLVEWFIYYASSDTRIHVAATTVEKMLDYVVNTPEDGLRSRASVARRKELIRKNAAFLKSHRNKRIALK